MKLWTGSRPRAVQVLRLTGQVYDGRASAGVSATWSPPWPHPPANVCSSPSQCPVS